MVVSVSIGWKGSGLKGVPERIGIRRAALPGGQLSTLNPGGWLGMIPLMIRCRTFLGGVGGEDDQVEQVVC